MADWGTLANVATATGTLVLAVATFASVRSANRTARNSERALQVGLRPVLFASREEDPNQHIRWGDDHWATLPGGQAVLEWANENVYMAMSLRNVGSGLAVLHSWRVEPADVPITTTSQFQQRQAALVRPNTDEFRLQGRDLYVPPGDMSFWQAAIRDPDYPRRKEILHAVKTRQGVQIDLLYNDHEGGQRTISRSR